jgi:hypothetical protein
MTTKEVKKEAFKHEIAPKPPHAGSSSWLGQDGKPVNVSGNDSALVADVLTRINDLMYWNDFIFGVRGYGGNVILTDNGTNGGAYHMGCDFVNGGNWYEALYSPPNPPSSPGGITFGLVQAEVVESYMGIAFNGGPKTIDCGDSFGEALSRYCAMSVTGGTNGSMGTSGFVSATSWDGSDWISRLSGTDGDYSSTGCGMVYISWMLKQGYTLDKIAQAGGPTCADNYAALTGKPSSAAWQDFMAALTAIGGLGAIKNDNPFGAPDPVYPLGTPVPPVPPVPPSPPSPPPPPGTQQVVVIPDQNVSFSVPGLFRPHSVTITIPGGTYPVVNQANAGAINPAVFGDLVNLLFAFFSKNPTAVAAALAKLLADLGLGTHTISASAINPAVFGDLLALMFAFISKDPTAIAAAIAKLMADLGLGG